MSQYIHVAENEGDEPMEVPSEEDGTLLLTTLSAQFPGACGLKYRNQETGTLRGIRLSDGRLYPPDTDWANQVYIVVFPKGICIHLNTFISFSLRHCITINPPSIELKTSTFPPHTTPTTRT